MLPQLIKAVGDILYPKICLACKKKLDKSCVDNLVCAGCWEKIERNIPPFCHSCGRHLERSNFNKNLCLTCLKKQMHFDRALAPCTYTGVVKELIHHFKYNGKDYLGSSLSRLMIDFIGEYDFPIEDMDLILPMPLYPTKLRQREFNQAEILAKYISEAFKKNLNNGILKRSRFTKTQTELAFEERQLNVKNSFSVTKEGLVRRKNILLVDDVLTSGATSSEAALHLKNAGANIVFVLTLAN